MWNRAPKPAVVLAIALGLSAACTSDKGGEARRPRPPADSRLKPPIVSKKPVPSAPKPVLSSYERAEALSRYAAGISADLNNQPDQALEHFRRSALADPGQEQVVLEVVRRYLQRKDIPIALVFLEEISKSPLAPASVHALKGMVYAQAGEVEKAMEANQAAIRAAPDSIAGYQNLFRLFIQGKKHPEARQVLDQAFKVPGAGAGFLVDLAELYAQYTREVPTEEKKVRPLVIKLLERAESLESKSPFIRLKVADGYQLMGEESKAVKIYQEILKEYPEFPALREKLAYLYWRQQDYEQAAQEIEKLLEQQPTNYQLYHDLANLAFEKKDFSKAAENYRKALLFNPGLQQAYYDLAASYLNDNKPGDAVRVLNDAGERFPKTFISEYLRALIASRTKDYPKALEHFTEAEILARAGDSKRLTAGFYFEVGATAERNKDYELAERHFEKALELDPDFAEALNYLGYMWAELDRNLPRARQLIEKAVKLEPKNAAFLDSMAWVLYKLDEPEKALDYLKEAIDLTEEPDPTLFDHLGDIYKRLNRLDSALEAWRKSIAIEPNDAILEKINAAGGRTGQ